VNERIRARELRVIDDQGNQLGVMTYFDAMKAAREAGLPRIFELETEYEEQQLAAELKFVNALIDEMATGTLEGLDMWRMFHTEGFDPEEVHFSFDIDPDA